MYHPTKYWHKLDDGRVQCDVCPRACKMHDGQRGLCFVRGVEGGEVKLYTYGRSSGFCVDPIEKKPLNHFLPGTSVLSFGTAGCNLACKFCQNWDMSKSREMDTLADRASPEQLAASAQRLGCASVAYTYNDPVVFMEYAIDVADACRERGVRSVAVTAGYMCPQPRAEFYRHMDAANVDLKGFTERFYRKICGAELGAVLETLEYLRHETQVWFEITTLLIPDENDSNAELEQMTRWIADKLGPDVPLHFTAFHPDWKMMDKPRTPAATLTRAREIALKNGLQLRLHRQRARPGRLEHVLRRLRQPRDRARLVRAGRMAAGRAGPLPAMRRAASRRLRRRAGHLGCPALASAGSRV